MCMCVMFSNLIRCIFRFCLKFSLLTLSSWLWMFGFQWIRSCSKKSNICSKWSFYTAMNLKSKKCIKKCTTGYVDKSTSQADKCKSKKHPWCASTSWYCLADIVKCKYKAENSSWIILTQIIRDMGPLWRQTILFATPFGVKCFVVLCLPHDFINIMDIAFILFVHRIQKKWWIKAWLNQAEVLWSLPNTGVGIWSTFIKWILSNYNYINP